MPSLKDKPEVEITRSLPTQTLWATAGKDFTGCGIVVKSSGLTAIW